MTKDLQKDDVGTLIDLVLNDLGTVVNLSTSTARQIIFTKPDGTLLTKNASLATDGTDGVIRYATLAGDLDMVGKWRVQGYVETPSGAWHSEVLEFRVKANLE